MEGGDSACLVIGDREGGGDGGAEAVGGAGGAV